MGKVFRDNVDNKIWRLVMVNLINFNGFIVGWLLFFGVFIGIYWVLYYYKRVLELGKSFVKRIFILFLFFGLGFVSVIIDLFILRFFWFLMVIFYIFLYVVILFMIFLSLRVVVISIEKLEGVKERSIV